MRVRSLLWVGTLALLAGCAGSGPKFQEMKSSLPVLRQGDGRVFFMRSGSMFGAAIQPEIRLNGEVVGTSVPGGFFFVDRAAGNYEAHASTEVERKLTFTLAAGETKYVRTSPSFGVLVGRINFDLVDPAQAATELDELSFTGPTTERQK